MKTYSTNHMVEVTDIEKEARYILGNLFERGWDDWGLIERITAKAMQADYYSARTKEDWLKVAQALESMTLKNDKETKDLIKTSFNRMVRGGYLRSRMSDGERVYEVAYSGI